MRAYKCICVYYVEYGNYISLQVVHNVGLCIALWDILKLEDSYIFPGDGSYHTVGKLSPYMGESFQD